MFETIVYPSLSVSLHTFLDVQVPGLLGDVARPGHTDPLTSAQGGEADRRDTGRGDQALPLIQPTLGPELVAN